MQSFIQNAKPTTPKRKKPSTSQNPSNKSKTSKRKDDADDEGYFE